MYATSPAATKPPTWYRVGSWLLFTWMLLGVLSFLNSEFMSAEATAALPQEIQDLMAATPMWMRVMYGVATLSGFVGGLGLVVRKAWSLPLLVGSLVAVVLQMGYWLFGMGAMEALGSGAAGIPSVVIILGAFGVWFAITAKKSGVIVG